MRTDTESSRSSRCACGSSAFVLRGDELSAGQECSSGCVRRDGGWHVSCVCVRACASACVAPVRRAPAPSCAAPPHMTSPRTALSCSARGLLRAHERGTRCEVRAGSDYVARATRGEPRAESRKSRGVDGSATGAQSRRSLSGVDHISSADTRFSAPPRAQALATAIQNDCRTARGPRRGTCGNVRGLPTRAELRGAWAQQLRSSITAVTPLRRSAVVCSTIKKTARSARMGPDVAAAMH